jgi:GNAT superfamily N-acetyltransferase
MITYRWINGWEATESELRRIEDILAARGWMPLAPDSSRILVAEDGVVMCGFIILQMVPHTEPLYVAPTHRGTDIAATLADKMVEFLAEIHVRGWMVVADNPIAAKLCEERGMVKIEAPVYVR